MPERNKRKIPWQDREKIGQAPAFFLTILEAFLSPVLYYEKLEVKAEIHDALVLAFWNSLYLTGPLAARMLSWPYFIALLFVPCATLGVMILSAWVASRVLIFLGNETDFQSCFHVLAFATPAFVLAYIPGAGYDLAIIAFTIFVIVGSWLVCRIGFFLVIPVLMAVPLIIFVTYGPLHLAKKWEENHPRQDIEENAQNILAVISVAAENYAMSHKGQYPKNSAALVEPPNPYLVMDYCGQTMAHYSFYCGFRKNGYYLEARPQGWEGRGKKIFYVTTGGQLRYR